MLIPWNSNTERSCKPGVESKVISQLRSQSRVKETTGGGSCTRGDIASARLGLVKIRRPSQEASIPLVLCSITGSEHFHGLQVRAKGLDWKGIAVFRKGRSLERRIPKYLWSERYPQSTSWQHMKHLVMVDSPVKSHASFYYFLCFPPGTLHRGCLDGWLSRHHLDILLLRNSGILRDRLKIMFKWRTRNNPPTKCGNAC